MKRLLLAAAPAVALVSFAAPAHAADNGNAAPTTTLVKVTATTVLAGPATTNPPQDDSDDDSDKTGLWGLLGLLGLAGLAGLKRKPETHPPAGGTPVRADTTPRGSTPSGR